MPEIEVSIGGRFFEVACQDGEEHFLEAAARLLDAEASSLTQQMGRLSEARMLLMSGLMLADKTAGLEDHIKELAEKLRAQEKLIGELRAAAETAAAPVVSDAQIALVDRAEDLAGRLEHAVASG